MLVAGAGVAGLAVARALQVRGSSVEMVEMVERAPAWTEAGTGIYLPGNATRALRALSLGTALLERAVVIPSQRFCDARGRVLCEIDLGAVWGEVGPCVAIRHADLHGVLREGAEEVPLRMGVRVAALALDDMSVTVEFSDTTSAAYDLVIGADGVHSTVRRLALGPECPEGPGGASAAVRPAGQIGWRFVTACPPEATTWSVQLGRRSALLTLPLGGGRLYGYCDALDGPDADGSPARLWEVLSEFGPPGQQILEALGDADALHVDAIEEVVLDTWSRGRVLLIGDAAHATSPNMAQGAAMALEDALVLAECVAEQSSVDAALAAFSARRKPRNDWVLAQTRSRDRTRNLPPAIRNLVLRRLGQRIYRANYRPLLATP